jgi:hypothetical protein
MMDIGEVKSYATQYSARAEKPDSFQTPYDTAQDISPPKKRKAVLPDFQKWL